MTQWVQTQRSVRSVILRMEDTIQRIAVRETGDAANWPTLVALNALVPPYLTDDESAAVSGVLLNGRDTILVPARRQDPTGISKKADPYGTDVMLVNGQIAISSTGDFATTSGTDNMVDALKRRMAVRAGELVFHNDYGCKVWRLVGKGGNVITNGLAATWLCQSVTADPRVVTASVNAVMSGDTIAMTADIQTSDGTIVPVSADLQ